MIVDDLKKEKCNGCKMCADVCPQDAITFENDQVTGFWYPKVDKQKCIDCGICIKKCPQNNPLRRKICVKEKVFAAWSNDDNVRLLCTSGGIFLELARSVIRKKGAVVACAYTDDYRGAYHCIATSEDELIPLCGSKHLQSDTNQIYAKTKELLKKYSKVLFVGTPCQVAALHSFLGNEEEGLITVDFICNSINSPKAQARYIDYLEEVYGSKVVYARSKDKREGWTNFGSSAKFENGQEYYASRDEDARVVGYHRGHLFVRESCLDCRYKELPRNADITLGDFWGIEKNEKNPKLELGTSVVIANSEKGRKYFESELGNVLYYEKTIDDVLKGNPALLYSAQASKRRKEAFLKLDKMRFDKVVNKYKDKNDKGIISRIKKLAKIILNNLDWRKR